MAAPSARRATTTMKAIEFPEVNIRIAEHQEEYETLPVYVQRDNSSLRRVTMCFELDEAEKKQVAETGLIWLTVLQPIDSNFHPISTSCLKPENFE